MAASTTGLSRVGAVKRRVEAAVTLTRSAAAEGVGSTDSAAVMGDATTDESLGGRPRLPGTRPTARAVAVRVARLLSAALEAKRAKCRGRAIIAPVRFNGPGPNIKK